MAKFVKGDVIVLPFPFSDLKQFKRRPALIIAELEGDDVMLCQITSQQIKDRYAVSIDEDDFETGTLKQRRKFNNEVQHLGCLCYPKCYEKTIQSSL